jgi:hypothetical protein
VVIRSELEGVNEMLLIKTRARKLILKFEANAKNEQNSPKMHFKTISQILATDKFTVFN